MDLIYADEKKVDQGILKDYVFDLAIGGGENTFECKINLKQHCCKPGYFLYIENTEYGGIIDSITVNTKEEEVIYEGRTWHGILQGKIVEPPSGSDYLYVGGYVSEAVKSLVDRVDVSELFAVPQYETGNRILGEKIDRYVDLLSVINRLSWKMGHKCKYDFKNGMVNIHVVPSVDYSSDDMYDSDRLDFVIKKNYHPVNHMICLGAGTLKDRMVVHHYVDYDGKTYAVRKIAGIDEITAIYDYPNCESYQELNYKGAEKLKELRSEATTIEFDLKQDDDSYDIGDIVGAKERTTGVDVVARIVKKIVSIKDNTTSISYELEEK